MKTILRITCKEKKLYLDIDLKKLSNVLAKIDSKNLSKEELQDEVDKIIKDCSHSHMNNEKSKDNILREEFVEVIDGTVKPLEVVWSIEKVGSINFCIDLEDYLFNKNGNAMTKRLVCTGIVLKPVKENNFEEENELER